mgnify:CR=1 FL=1
MPKNFDFLSPGIQITEIDESVLPDDTIEDGPIIIGRTAKGPGMQPVKIKSLDAFIRVFGKPVAGGSSESGDIWRDGPNLSAPTYASYAAQAWLASGNSPITVVRVLGDESPSGTDDTDGVAGWQVGGRNSGGKPYTNPSLNSTAYGLFIVDNGKIAAATSKSVEVDGATAIPVGFNSVNVDVIRGGSVKATIAFSNSVAAGSVSNNNTTITVGTDGLSTKAEIQDALRDGIEKAIELAFIKNVSISINGEILTYSNHDTVDYFQLQASAGSAFNIIGGSDMQHNLATARALAAPKEVGTGALAAILYCNSGYLELTDGTNSGANRLIPSKGDSLEFGLKVFNTSGNQVGGDLSFNFTKNSGKYIRNVLNTNPQLVNSQMTSTNNLKTYWLGETFERHLKTLVTGSTVSNQVGTLLPLHRKDIALTVANGNYGYQRKPHQVAKSGWVIAQDAEGNQTKFSPESAAKHTRLFRFVSLHSGEEIQKQIMIGISNIKQSNNPIATKYGTFSVEIMDTAGNVLEKFNNLNLDPSDSERYIATRIGDQYLKWDTNPETGLRFNMEGSNPNRSDYVRIEMYTETRQYNETDLPFGFLGPGRPSTFMITSGSTTVYDKHGKELSNAFVRGSGSVPGDTIGQLTADNGIAGNGEFTSFGYTVGGAEFKNTGASIKFEWPKLNLRYSGSFGGATNQYKQYYGIFPKISNTSTKHDSDYVDYLRALPSAYDAQLWEPSKAQGFEHSFAFSLDDIRIDEFTNIVTYESGSRRAELSYTVASGSKALLIRRLTSFSCLCLVVDLDLISPKSNHLAIE